MTTVTSGGIWGINFPGSLRLPLTGGWNVPFRRSEPATVARLVTGVVLGRSCASATTLAVQQGWGGAIEKFEKPRSLQPSDAVGGGSFSERSAKRSWPKFEVHTGSVTQTAG